MRATRITTAAVITALTFTTAVPALATTPGYDRAALQADLDAIRDAGSVGVQAQVDTGSRRWSARSGVAEAGTAKPVPRDGAFRIGSNTKTFVAVVVLQLVGQGRLSLEDKVADLLPGVVTSPGGDQITVRQLLQHTSGLYNYTNDLPLRSEAEFLAHRFDSTSAEVLVKQAMAQPPEFAPGTSWNYSNTNYLLAGMLIEQVTGNPWAAEVRSRILKPLGLRDTYSPGERVGLPHPHAHGYSVFPGTTKVVDTTELNPSWGGAAGDMISTPTDLSRFWQALLGGRLLRQSEFAEMRKTVPAKTWQETDPGSEYGLGITSTPLSCGGVSWSHGGDIHGFQTRNGFSDDGRRGIVLSLSTQDFGGPSTEVTKRVLDRALCD
ncbi:serine hydrolase domain-containing protein [Amycolatopsis magusensis]|uniref:serine hydrolase domain-containing protein n=1 Tax=Amycolatopsis magusensis TaxID=882444 RepID=UPI0037B6D02E